MLIVRDDEHIAISNRGRQRSITDGSEKVVGECQSGGDWVAVLADLKLLLYFICG